MIFRTCGFVGWEPYRISNITCYLSTLTVFRKKKKKHLILCRPIDEINESVHGHGPVDDHRVGHGDLDFLRRYRVPHVEYVFYRIRNVHGQQSVRRANKKKKKLIDFLRIFLEVVVYLRIVFKEYNDPGMLNSTLSARIPFTVCLAACSTFKTGVLESDL